MSWKKNIAKSMAFKNKLFGKLSAQTIILPTLLDPLVVALRSSNLSSENGADKHRQSQSKRQRDKQPKGTPQQDTDSVVEAATFVARAAIIRKPNHIAWLLEPIVQSWPRRRMRLVLINDDMPFLVDSVALTISALGLAIDHIIHPILSVHRDSAGRLTKITPHKSQDSQRESFIYIELAHGNARTRQRLLAMLEAAMEDVRTAVRDWQAMRQAMRSDADWLNKNGLSTHGAQPKRNVLSPKPTQSDQSITEAATLLRWFADNNMTHIGYECRSRSGQVTKQLGICTTARGLPLSHTAIADAFAWFDSGGQAPLLIKSNYMSRVHRRALLDIVLVPIDKDTLSIHVGLWTSVALSAPPQQVPLLRRQLDQLIQQSDLDTTSHSGKAVIHSFTTLPHDLMVGFDSAAAARLVLASMSNTDRPRPQIIMAMDALHRHLYAFIWLPRDDVSTRQRLEIEALLEGEAQAKLISRSMALEDGGVALLRYTLDLRDGGVFPDADMLNRRLERMVRGWLPDVEAALASHCEESRAFVLTRRFGLRLPVNYRYLYGAQEAALDILRLAQMSIARPYAARLTQSDTQGALRLKLYSADKTIALRKTVPTLENFGFAVESEIPTLLDNNATNPRSKIMQTTGGAGTETRGDSGRGATSTAKPAGEISPSNQADPPSDRVETVIHDFTLNLPATFDSGRILQRAAMIEEAIVATLDERAENDRFNQLFMATDLTPDAIIWFRAWFRYLRQAGLPYGMDTVVATLQTAPDITSALAARFRALHDPAAQDGALAEKLHQEIGAAITRVTAIDDDRILRLFAALVDATLRTNVFATAGTEALAFKFDSRVIPCLPKPLPWREIFVYSPRVEGIHLRAGPVARGGLRWSDRRNDYRTEILGLMKAQRVKNAVIVPTGAKGGFYPKTLPDIAQDRDGWLAEGTECYCIFIRALLSITDNIVDGKTVHPNNIIARDGDDPYFVVAADKGTARFSDVANDIAMAQGFWLGDAFASGGSHGYDHKTMGITAKGAWVSVQHHFTEMAINVQKDSIRVAGCGDMSGDVFGNGMLLSQAIKLVAAFDHRHIFLDPDPDPNHSWHERQRLYNNPRSSWADYDVALISEGGGVFSRQQKNIVLRPEIQAMLGIADETIGPDALISAILIAPIDLLWFGGIGTYIKAKAENNSTVGDPINDSLRANAEDLRCQVIGEGANLAITQAGRIAFSRKGGRINCDFIDNSAGVACSDLEVNIKILLEQERAAGRLNLTDRNALLAEMAGSVSALVLENNRSQALALSIAESRGATTLPAVVRIIDMFEASGSLDRAVEGIAANDDLLQRAQEGRGLYRPEFAVLLSTAKLELQAAIEKSDLVTSAQISEDLRAAFPPEIQSKFSTAIAAHPLRNEITATRLANRIVNRLGVALPFELIEEEGCALSDMAAAYLVVETLFDMPQIWHKLDTATMEEATRLSLFTQAATAMTSQMADLLRLIPREISSLDILVSRLQPRVRHLTANVDHLLNDMVRRQWDNHAEKFTDMGVAPDLVQSVVRLFQVDGIIGLADLAERKSSDEMAITRAFSRLGEVLGLDWAQTLAARMAPVDPWERLLVNRIARDFQQMRLDFLSRQDLSDPCQAVADWLANQGARIEQFCAIVERARRTPNPSGAMLSHIAGQARNLLAR